MNSARRRDYIAGALCSALGVGTVTEASRYSIGTLGAMGPGFYPAVLGAILAVTGVLIAANASDHETADPLHAVTERVDWRGVVCIISAVALFIVLVENAGLLAATFVAVLVAALGDRQATLRGSAALAAGIALFGAILFRWLLSVDLPLWP
jgi:hypothetical protein